MRVTSAGSGARRPRPGPTSSATAATRRASPRGQTVTGRPPTLLLDAGTGLRRLTALLRWPRRSRAPSCSTHLHWDHVQGLPFFRGGDREDARVRLLLPDQGDGADAEALLARMMSPPFFPIDAVTAARRLELRRLPERHFTAEGFTRPRPRRSPTRGAHRRLPGQRRAFVGGLRPRPLPDGPRAPDPTGWGEYHEAPSSWPATSTSSSTTPTCGPRRSQAEGSFGHAAADYAVGLGTRPAPAGRALPPPAGARRRRGRADWCAGSPGPAPVVAAARARSLSCDPL